MAGAVELRLGRLRRRALQVQGPQIFERVEVKEIHFSGGLDVLNRAIPVFGAVCFLGCGECLRCGFRRLVAEATGGDRTARAAWLARRKLDCQYARGDGVDLPLTENRTRVVDEADFRKAWGLGWQVEGAVAEDSGLRNDSLRADIDELDPQIAESVRAEGINDAGDLTEKGEGE